MHKRSGRPRAHSAALLFASLCGAQPSFGGQFQLFPEGPAYLETTADRVALKGDRIAWGASTLFTSDLDFVERRGLIPPSGIVALSWQGDGLLALAAAHGLLVIDDQGPRPRIEAELPLPAAHEVTDIAVIGTDAFVTGWRSINHWREENGYLFEIDLSDPRVPVLMSTSFQASRGFHHIRGESGEDLYLASKCALFKAERVATGAGFDFRMFAEGCHDSIRGICVGWGGLFVAWASNRVDVYRVLPDALPVLAASIEDAGTRSIETLAQRPVVLLLSQSELLAYDVSNLAAPVFLWREEAGGGTDLAVGADRVVHTTREGSYGGLQQWQVRDGQPIPGAELGFGDDLKDYDVAGDLAVAATEVSSWDDYLACAIDETTKALTPLPHSPSRITAVGRTAHLGGYSTGLRVYEVLPDAVATHRATIDSGATMLETLAHGDVAVNMGRILDLTDPLAPVVTDTLDLIQEGLRIHNQDLAESGDDLLYTFHAEKDTWDEEQYGVLRIAAGRFEPVLQDTMALVRDVALDPTRQELIVARWYDLIRIPYAGPMKGQRTVLEKPLGDLYLSQAVQVYQGWLFTAWEYSDWGNQVWGNHYPVIAHRLGALDQQGWRRDFDSVSYLRRVRGGVGIVGRFGGWTVDLDPPESDLPIPELPRLD
ncbi:MAG: hypothetical protein CME06_17570 [Gemmatimonadetes bacterium]|nr:hypothetical protein [Gemmatimonadota bacterium]